MQGIINSTVEKHFEYLLQLFWLKVNKSKLEVQTRYKLGKEKDKFA